MKNTISLLIFSLFISANTFAADMSFLPVGTFKYTGDTEVLSVKKSEVVETLTKAGKEHLQELKNQGWTCMNIATSTSRCSIFLKDQSAPLEAILYFSQRYDFSITFSEVFGVDEVNDSESLREYEVDQDVSVGEEKVSKYSLLSLQDGPKKMWIGLQNGLNMNAISSDKVAVFETFKVQENTQVTSYSILVIFTK